MNDLVWKARLMRQRFPSIGGKWSGISLMIEKVQQRFPSMHSTDTEERP
jgi:hypothetical protein